MRLLNNKKGVTFIDTMMSMLIVSLISVGLVSTLTQSMRGWSRGASQEAANNSATVAAQRLSYDIRDGRTATANSTFTQLTVTFPKLLTDSATKESAYDAVLNDPNPRVYYISHGNLVKQVGTQTTILAKGIAADKTTFNASDGVVDVTITSRQQLGSSVWEKQATIHLSMRNHH